MPVPLISRSAASKATDLTCGGSSKSARANGKRIRVVNCTGDITKAQPVRYGWRSLEHLMGEVDVSRRRSDAAWREPIYTCVVRCTLAANNSTMVMNHKLTSPTLEECRGQATDSGNGRNHPRTLHHIPTPGTKLLMILRHTPATATPHPTHASCRAGAQHKILEAVVTPRPIPQGEPSN